MKNKKKNIRREAYKVRQEEEGKSVVKWIFAILVVLAICFMAYSMYIVS